MIALTSEKMKDSRQSESLLRGVARRFIMGSGFDSHLRFFERKTEEQIELESAKAEKT